MRREWTCERWGSEGGSEGVGSIADSIAHTSPEWIASTMARVYLRGQRLPFAPPTQPVLSNQAVA